MGTDTSTYSCSIGVRLLLALWLTAALPAQAQSRSELSRWLSDTLAPQLSELLTRHPRYQARPLEIVNTGGDALGDAVATVLRAQLGTQPAIALVSNTRNAPAISTTAIDDLRCAPAVDEGLQLRIALQEERQNRYRLALALTEAGPGGAAAPREWLWSGRLTRFERERAEQPAEPLPADGSLASPWHESDVDAAARALSRELACGLRPGIDTHLRLSWPENRPLPAVIRDTVNGSRHLLGAYHELRLTEQSGDYRIAVELRPFRDSTYQLWLRAQPRDPSRGPAQAVTYFQLPALQWAAAQPAIPGPIPRRPAEEFLQVELLDAYQTVRGSAAADLHLALRLNNSAEWPIAFALRLSAGHFRHCEARPAYYRHDRYGTLTGTLQPGVSELQTLVVEKLRHAPAPWFGTPRCAGSIDLDAFDHYATDGARVTDYVRWDF